MASCKRSWPDKFSDLPDEVAHHILSFLVLIDQTCVGAVSKRCRKFYLSNPSVNVDGYTYAGLRPHRLATFMCFWDRYFFQRRDHKMQRLHINWRFLTLGTSAKRDCEELFRITSWIHNAVRCNVDELNLSFSSAASHVGGFTFGLPSCLYESRSFKSLVVTCFSEMTLKAPPVSISCCYLHSLHLNSVRIDDDQRLSNWISYSCKCIRKLQLIQVKGFTVISIRSSSLESFEFIGIDLITLYISGDKLSHVNINWNFYSGDNLSHVNIPADSSLQLFAPNLLDLKWVGKVLNSIDLGNLLNLQRAQIFLEPTDHHNLSDVFSKICWTKGLGINQNTMKAMLKECSEQTPLQILLLAVVLTNLSNDMVPLMASLLRRTSLLRWLSITSASSVGDLNLISQSSGFDKGYWESQNFAFVNHLADLSIDLSCGSNELEFAKYLIENAPNLKKMVIRYRPGFQQSDTLVRKISRCKNISGVIILIQEVQ